MTDDDTVRDEGFDDLLDAIAEGAGYYLACPDDHGTLPPARVCPVCGDSDLTETPLPETGTVVTYTVVHVGTPEYEAETPYVTAVAAFGDVRLTGLLDGVAPDAVDLELAVEPAVGETADGRRRIELRPA